MTKPPRRWLAALLSIVVPGTGQLYAGRAKRAVTFFLAAGLTVLLASYTLLLVPPMYGVVICVVGTVGLPIAAAVDAWHVAARWPTDLARPAFSRWYAVLPIFLAVALGLNALNDFRKAELVEAFELPSAAMEPTLLVGDYIIVDKRGPARLPTHGAIIVHESVEEAGLKVIKRVVGLPHDTIEMRHGALLLNGLPVREQYVGPLDEAARADPDQQRRMRAWQLPHVVGRADSLYTPDLNDWGPLLVPNDSVFTLGDNRNGSYDSRYFGFVPFSHVLGRAQYVYLSRDSTGAVRWERSGRTVQ